MRRHKWLAAAICTLGASAAAGGELSDAQVRELVVRASIAAYSGNCPCPYHTDRAGHSCGARSAWSRAGGASPLCYTREVTDQQVRTFRERQRL